MGFWAKVTDDVMEGQVEVNVGGGTPIQAEAWREANTNRLTDYRNRDPISGFPVYKALLCEVRKRECNGRGEGGGPFPGLRPPFRALAVTNPGNPLDSELNPLSRS